MFTRTREPASLAQTFAKRFRKLTHVDEPQMFMNSYVLQVPVFQHNVKGEGGQEWSREEKGIRRGVGRRRGSGEEGSREEYLANP